jgi:hypothetical protein
MLSPCFAIFCPQVQANQDFTQVIRVSWLYKSKQIKILRAEIQKKMIYKVAPVGDDQVQGNDRDSPLTPPFKFGAADFASSPGIVIPPALLLRLGNYGRHS